MSAAGVLIVHAVRAGVLHGKSPRQVCVEMQNADNMQYVTPIELGTPGQIMNAIPDTGSFELVIPSTDCGDGCRGHPLFNSSKSTSFNFRGAPQTIHYGQGDVITEVDYDSVKLGGMTVEEQSLLKMTNNGLENYDSATYDAVMGLGMSEEARPGDSDLSLLASLQEKSFGICLGQNDGEAGRLDLGGGVPGLNYREVPAMQGTGHWGLRLSKFKVGKDEVGDRNMNVIIDSGTSLFAVPTALLDKTLDAIGDVAEDCSNIKSLPNLELQVSEGHSFIIPPDLYVGLVQLDPVDEDGTSIMGQSKFVTPFRFASRAARSSKQRMAARSAASTSLLHQESAPQANATAGEAAALLSGRSYTESVKEQKAAPQGDDNICIPLFMELNVYSDDGPLFILGMPFLRAYATRFNLAKKQIGFAQLPMNAGQCTPCKQSGGGGGRSSSATKLYEEQSHAMLPLSGPKVKAHPKRDRGPIAINMKRVLLPWWAVRQSKPQNDSAHASRVLGRHLSRSAPWRYMHRL